MKKSLLLFFSIISAVLCHGQISTKDSTVNVVAYFNKGDTVIYDYTHKNPKYIGKDTLYDAYLTARFQLSVLSASDKGYRIEYTSGSYVCAPDSVLTEAGRIGIKMVKAVEQIGNKMKPIFVLDEYGTLKGIENSKEIISKWGKLVDVAIKTIYKEDPRLEKVIDKKAMKEYMLSTARTEADLWKLYEEMVLLFGYHGRAFDMKKTTIESETGVTEVFCGKDRPDKYGTDNDYMVYAKQTTKIPSETVQALVGGQMEQLVGKEMVDSLQNIVKGATGWPDIEVTNTHIVRYWSNGWPKETSTVKKVQPKSAVKEELAKPSEIRTIEWVSYRVK